MSCPCSTCPWLHAVTPTTTTGAAGVAFGAVAPANAQPPKGSKRPTPKKTGTDFMPAKNFAPVVSALYFMSNICVPSV